MNNIIEYIGFHGTMKSNFDKIDKLKKFKSNVLPNDLGNGLYFFYK